MNGIAKTVAQAARYYSFGLAINVAAYGGFLLLLQTGMGVKTSFTLVFIVAITVSFWINRRYVFRSNASVSTGYALHWLNAGAAYAINLTALWIFVDRLGMLPAYVQIASTIFTSGLLFISNKVFIHERN